MKRVQEYRQNAEACRLLAKGAKTAESRSQLGTLADAWEAIAAERERFLESQQSAKPGKNLQ